MSEENIEKSALVPRLRFPEFRDGWRLFTVSDFFDLTDKSEKTTTFNKDKVLTVKLRANGVVKNEKTTLTGGANYFNRRSGQFVFSKIDLLNGAFGVVPDNLDGFASSSDVPAYSFNAEHSSTFFVNWLKANYENLDIERTGTSTTLKRVSPEKFLALAVSAPNFPEQQKIADCLSSLDELIAAETQKLDALKTHKKGLMQQLFPREGETVPRLRYPQFREAREWEEKPIGEMLDLLSGFPFDGTDIREDASGVPLMRGINITEGFIRHNQDIDRFFCCSSAELEKYRLLENDLVVGMDGAKVGKNSALVTSSDAGALLVQRVARLRSGCKTTIRFVFQHINSNVFHAYVDRINTSGGIPHISLKQISDFKICFPGISEQQQIVDCLSSLDDIITAQSQEIDTLKTHKKGLMQQLFPVLDEAQA